MNDAAAREATELYSAEASLLYTHLGSVTTGGMIESIAAFGAASVPTLDVAAPLEIALAAWPFPLGDAARKVLNTLAYEPVAEFAGKPEQRFFHKGKDIYLYVVSAGSERYTRRLVLRDFLQHSAGARARFRELHPLQENSPEASAFFEEAERWWTAFHGFSPLEASTQEFRGFAHPWLFSSGWALDLFLGRVTRVHHDIDVVVPRTAIWPLKHYLNALGWRFVLPLDGRLEPWPPESRREPDIQLHAHKDGAIIDVLLTEMDGETWHYRRDPRITCPAAQAYRTTASGLPYLAPELVLLFKSKNTSHPQAPRPQDEEDFENVSPRLSRKQRTWLREALSLTDPNHGWLEALS